MGTTLILIGITCIIAGIVGGGITLNRLSVPSVTSIWRQGLLAVFGAFLSLAGVIALPDADEPQGSNEALADGGVSNDVQEANSETANVAEAEANSDMANNEAAAENVSNAAGSSDVPQ